ncbi:MAG: ABC transporter ATP-binding protein [Phototrophicaceae bacterium]
MIIDIHHIAKVYQMGEMEVHALRDVNLRICEGEFVSIMGPSGSGKSTLMNILGALDQPTSGEYFLDGVNVAKLKERDLAQVRNKKIGFVFQSYNLLKRTTALRQVELPLIYAGASNRTARAKEALTMVGLERRMDHLPTELSGGQQQRVAIARALVNRPAMILADEATGNLDSKSGTEVMKILQDLNEQQGITVVFVTHDPWTARHTKRLVMLRDGAVVADQPVPNPLVAGESERPSEAAELESIFQTTYDAAQAAEFN